MKITEQEQQDIKSVLWQNIKFRETIDEVYDHILSSVEEMPTEGNPGAIARNIINTEFGGWDGIKESEQERLKAVRKYVGNRLWQYIKNWFSLPLILLTVLIAIGIYNMAGYIPRRVLFLVVFGIAMMPLPYWLKIAPCNRFSKKYKPSIKECIAERIATFGISIFNCLLFLPGVLLNDENYKFLRDGHIAIITPVVILYLIYGISSVKVLKEDLRISVVK
ncbi:hypothetical protein [Mucilaginibacter terrae]|uniref:DUF1129 domain-containing protein n=1 Tax=Mucilaginibacter terrae TaxID=1955052 RepID=A0ABU3GRS5_9SPHI|nr:hypothetical protein [Mucilaginibacter terrae]MDT3402466.1 hypothetical protein [Mucilaginibacter terrae]